MIPITGMDDFATALATLALADGRSVLVAVHGPTAGTAEISHATAYLVTAAGVATPIGSSEPRGKDVAVALSMSGTVLHMWVTEATPAGPGSSAHVDRYDFEIAVGQAGGASESAMRALLAKIATEIRGNVAAPGASELNRALYQGITGYAKQTHDPLVAEVVAKVGEVYKLERA